MVLEQSNDQTLIDYNYSIEMVMSSDSSNKIGEPLLMLELTLKLNQDGQGRDYSGRTMQRVILELNMDETRDFMDKLKQISNEVVGLSQ